MPGRGFGAERIVLDGRQAVRQLGARPFFTLAALTILAVGIGASTAAFSLVRGLRFPLPFPEPAAVMQIGRVPADFPDALPTLSSNELLRLRDEARSFDQIAASAMSPVVLDGPGGPTRVLAMAVTPSFFPLARVSLRLGRLFDAADAVEGAQPVVLLSHGAWMNRFAGDPDVVGQSVVLDGEPHVVAGVLAAGFEFGPTELWTPLSVRPDPDDERVPGGLVIGGGGFSVIGRLRPGVSPAQGEAEVRAILDRMPSAPTAPPGAGARLTRVAPLQEALGRRLRPALWMFTSAAGLVLLLACANVAGLLLARGAARRPELAVRGALGAGRGRIVCQLLTESVVLSAVGGSLGLAVAAGVVRAVPALVPRDVPGLADVGVDGAAVAFAVGLSVVAGLVSGAAPALAWSRVEWLRSLNDAGAPSGGGGRRGAFAGQAVLAVVQVALAVVLVSGAGLLLRSFAALVTFDFGFDPTHVMVARADNRDLRFTGERRVFDAEETAALNLAAQQSTEALLRQLERVAGLPGVQAAALATRPPLMGSGSRPIGVAGRPAPGDPRDWPQADVQSVSAGYADVIGLPLLTGRFFTARDDAGSPRAAVVSESFAREAFGGEPAVGQRLSDPFQAVAGPGDAETWEVVGVVGDVDSPSRADSPFPSAAGGVYLSLRQPGMDAGAFFTRPFVVVRTAGDPSAVVPFLREVLTDVYPGAFVDTTMLDAMLSARVAQSRFHVVCAGVFGAAALLLAAFGLYGVLGFMVSQRRREIGVRMALGAGKRAVIGLVLRRGGVLVGAGVLVGLPASAAATRVLESLLFGVRPADPPTLAGVTALLLAVGLLACWLPARRAARIDPLDVLRET